MVIIKEIIFIHWKIHQIKQIQTHGKMGKRSFL